MWGGRLVRVAAGCGVAVVIGIGGNFGIGAGSVGQRIGVGKGVVFFGVEVRSVGVVSDGDAVGGVGDGAVRAEVVGGVVNGSSFRC